MGAGMLWLWDRLATLESATEVLVFPVRLFALRPPVVGLAIGIMSASPIAGAAAELIPLRVNTFPNAKALALHAGLAKGIFEKHGLKVELQLTDNSKNQREGLAAGRFDIAQAALDNAVAMIEVAKQDVVIVSGGDSGMNEFFVQPDVRSFGDLKGRTIVVDAPDTAYALLAKKILSQYGLKAGTDYTVKPVGAGVYRLKAMLEDPINSGGILNLPFTVQAEEAGLKSLGRTVDLLGPYQAQGVFVMRAWVRDNGTLLERYLAAYVDALRWVRDRANRKEAVALLMDRLKLAAPAAERTYDLLLDPHFGFTPDAKFDPHGFRNMLGLRAEIEAKGDAPARAPETYVDLGYYERAVRSLQR
jgi:ABC-type nitrate/sulfonate/bicarbonate transport system substrate-binding protein